MATCHLALLAMISLCTWQKLCVTLAEISIQPVNQGPCKVIVVARSSFLTCENSAPGSGPARLPGLSGSMADAKAAWRSSALVPVPPAVLQCTVQRCPPQPSIRRPSQGSHLTRQTSPHPYTMPRSVQPSTSPMFLSILWDVPLMLM